MRAETPQQKQAILAATLAAVAGVLIVKHMIGGKELQGNAAAQAGPAVYLFLDEADQDGGCRQIYSLFEEGKSALPASVKTARVDVNHDSGLAGKLGVRVVPTVLFVDKNGKVIERIEGEGEKVATRLRTILADAPRRLSP